MSDAGTEKDSGRLLAHVEHAVDEERRRIASEIHDSLNASVIVLRLHAEGILHDAAKAGHRDMEEKARRILDAANQIYDNMKRVSKQLRPEVLDALGLCGAIAAMVRDLDDSHPSCRFECKRSQPEPTPPAAVSMTAYRVAQEALSNSVKHANASRVSVALECATPPHHMRMVISDNGQGLSTKERSRSGLGMIGMHDRVDACAGQLTVVSDKTGTCITVLL